MDELLDNFDNLIKEIYYILLLLVNYSHNFQ